VSLNVIRNHLRKAKALPEEAAEKRVPEAVDPRGGPDDQAIGREQGRQLQAYLMRLPVQVREALVLRFYEGLSFEDIASVTGDSLSSAKMKIYRGLEKIRVMMEEDGFADDESQS
jgi:RNA polymerase sigma-70 factor (ECF subfamily)